MNYMHRLLAQIRYYHAYQFVIRCNRIPKKNVKKWFYNNQIMGYQFKLSNWTVAELISCNVSSHKAHNIVRWVWIEGKSADWLHHAHKVVWRTIPSTHNRIRYNHNVSLLSFCARTKHIDNLKSFIVVHHNEEILEKLGFSYILISQSIILRTDLTLLIQDIVHYR